MPLETLTTPRENLPNVYTDVAAREIDFVSRFGSNWDALRKILGIMRPIRKAPGTSLVSYAASVTLVSGEVPEGAVIPYSKYQLEEVAHWAIPAGLYGVENATAQPGKAAEFEVTGTRLALRQGMTTQSPVIDRMERGSIISGTPVNSDWVKIEYNGKTGYSMAQYLRSTEPQEPADDSPDDAPDSPAAGLDDVTLTLSRKTAEALVNALTAGLDGG